MLRIKGNVDLKKLEKEYGFVKTQDGDLIKYFKVKNFPVFENVENVAILIDCSQYLGRIGIVCQGGEYCLDIELEILYDLIKEDLVEKVDEEQ